MITMMLAKFMFNDVPHAAGIAGSPKTRKEPDVVYHSQQAKQKVQSANGLSDFIMSHIMQLSTEHQRTPNYIMFEPNEGIASHSLGMINFDSDKLPGVWISDEAKVRKYLPFIIAHEYRHYLTGAKGMKIPYPKGPSWKIARRAYEEEAADEFAQEYTGISMEEARAAIDSMFGEGE